MKTTEVLGWTRETGKQKNKRELKGEEQKNKQDKGQTIQNTQTQPNKPNNHNKQPQTTTNNHNKQPQQTTYPVRTLGRRRLQNGRARRRGRVVARPAPSAASRRNCTVLRGRPCQAKSIKGGVKPIENSIRSYSSLSSNIKRKRPICSDQFNTVIHVFSYYEHVSCIIQSIDFTYPPTPAASKYSAAWGRSCGKPFKPW